MSFAFRVEVARRITQERDDLMARLASNFGATDAELRIGQGTIAGLNISLAILEDAFRNTGDA